LGSAVFLFNVAAIFGFRLLSLTDMQMFFQPFRKKFQELVFRHDWE